VIISNKFNLLKIHLTITNNKQVININMFGVCSNNLIKKL